MSKRFLEQIDFNGGQPYDFATKVSDLPNDAGYLVEDDMEHVVAGTAEDLLTDLGALDTSPYLYRQTPSDGDRAVLRKIVGGTLAWNQLVLDVNRSFTSAMSDTRPFTLQLRMFASPYTTAFISNVGLGKGIYTRLFVGIDTQGSGLYLTHNGSNNNIEIWRNTNQQLVVGHKYLFNVNVVNNDPTTVGGLVLEDMMLIDLTTLFGSTIADYIYSLEQATAGAGVAWVKQYIDLDTYHAYSAPTIKSVEGLESHNMTGKNLFDFSLRTSNKYLSTTDGSEVAQNGYYITPYIRVWANVPVCIPFSGSARRWFYDLGKNPKTYLNNSSSQVFTPQEDGYIRVTVSSTNSNATEYQVEFGSTPTAYEPYEKHSYPLDSSLTLRGIPKLDANNQLYFDGDEYESDGSVNRRYGVVDLGSLTGGWSPNGIDGVYKAISGKKVGSNNIMSDKLVVVAQGTSSNIMPDMSVKTYSSTNEIAVKMAGITSANAMTMLSGVMLVYELATPTTESAQPYEELQIVNDFGTEEFVSGNEVPVGNVTFYPISIRKQVENIAGIPAPPTTNGNYKLKLTVTDGKPVFTWVSES